MKEKKYADIIDVANHAHVSPATVSRFFNHSEMVKPPTRKRIQKAIEDTGYIRNRAAQAIHGIRSGTIGLIVPTLDSAIFSNLIQAFSERLSASKFTMLVATHGYDLNLEYELLRSLLEHRVEGIGLIGLNHKEETYALLERRETPAIAIWNYAVSTRVPCVGSDNYLAGQKIAEHMVSLGHERIALVFPETEDNDRAAQRYQGVIDTLHSFGLHVPDAWRATTKYSIRHARNACTPILQGRDRPTAMIGGNDVIAHGLIYAARALGLEVPTDVSIGGIGDFSGSEDTYPSLTTVRLRSNKIGQIAAENLIRQINNPDQPTIINVAVDLDLKARESTGLPPSINQARAQARGR